jgi:hypothetical protein
MGPLTFAEIQYEKLSGKQQESYNFQKLSAVLADFGYITIPLNNDWNGADFIAQASDGKTFIKVQLKSRLTFDEKYLDSQLYVCFRDGNPGPWYFYDHDKLLGQVDVKGKIRESKTWKDKKPYHFRKISTDVRKMLDLQYRIPDVGANRK